MTVSIDLQSPPAAGSAYPELPLTDGIIIVIDAHGIVRFATPAAIRYFGESASSAVGRSVLDYVVPEERAAVTERWRAFRDAPDRASGELVVRLDERLRHPQPLRVTAWRLPNETEFLLVFNLSDHVRDRLETLYSILVALSGAIKPDQVFDVVLTETLRLIPCDRCALLVVDPDGKLQIARSVGSLVEAGAAPPHDRLLERTMLQALRATGQPLIISDCQHDRRWDQRAPKSIQSWLGVPLLYRGEFFGALSLDSVRPEFFTAEDSSLVHALATQIAAAIFAARQYENELRRADRFRAVSEVSLAISQLDLASVLEVVYRKVSSLMDASSFFIGLYDAEAETLHIVGSYEHGERIPDEIQHASEGLVGLVLQTHERIIIRDSQLEPLPESVIIDGEVPRSLLMFPLIAQEKPVGVISVQSYQPHAYTPGDIALLETMAGAVATAIDNAQLYDATADQLAALETLHQMSLRLASVRDRERVAALTLEAVLELLAPSEAILYLAGDPPQAPGLWQGCRACDEGRSAIWRGDPAAHPLLQQIAATGDPVVLHTVTAPHAILPEHRRPIHALAGYPLVRGNAQLGALVLLYDQPHFFRQTTLRTLELLCMQAATALENASYYQRLRHRLDEVSALHDLARQVSNSDSLDEMLRLVTHRMRDVYGCRSASIALYDPDAGQVVTRAAVGIDPDIVATARFAPGEFVAGHVFATGEVVYVADTQAMARFRVLDPEIRSLLAVPLTVHDHVIGSMSIDSAAPDAFTPDHERLLTIAGSQLAAAIETLRLLDETRQRAAQLAEANRSLQAVDALRNELVQNLSHELRAPLALVRGYASLMREGELGPVSADQVSALETIQDRADAISRLINDILSLETIRRETLVLGLVDIAELVARAVNGARLVHGARGLTFVYDAPPGECIVEGDRDRLTQVLDNLLGNAIKFSPPGSVITVRLRPAPETGGATLDVIDQGIGIPADKLEHIFERFYQINYGELSPRSGAGLGLSIVKRILEAHGGAISVTSVEGVGSTFTCTLPLCGPPASQPGA